MNKICDWHQCFACSLCHDICPVGAIEMCNDTGFYRPYIGSNCINCGLCRNICPARKNDFGSTLEQPRDCFAAWSKESYRHYESSSGGLATLIAKKFIEHNGIVIGVEYSATRQEAEHCIVDIVPDLEKLAKSKYMQSNKTGIWKEIEQLPADKPILFVGVGCEVYALKKYIMTRRKQWINRDIYCIDLLCRGGASSLCFQQHLAKILHGKSASNVTFRGGAADCNFTVYDNAGTIIYKRPQFDDVYFAEFMRHSIFSPRCYDCPFARTQRGGDITLADFWGVADSIAQKSEGKGINLCFVNTDKGQYLFNLIQKSIIYFRRPLLEAMNGNETLVQPTRQPPRRSELWEDIPIIGFDNAARKTYPIYYGYVFLRSIRRYLRSLLPDSLYSVLKKIKNKKWREQ